MPDNPLSAASSDSTAKPAELNFEKPADDPQRIRRRSLKAKGSKPTAPVASPSAKASPAPEAPVVKPAAPSVPATASSSSVTRPLSPAPATASSSLRTASPAPSASTSNSTAASAGSGAANGTTRPATTSSSTTAGHTTNNHNNAAAKPATTPASSPHGTRPATLYYSSYPRKDGATSATPSSMKTTAPASSSGSNATRPAAAAPAAATVAPAAATRPSTPADYRANVERQTREQKSVGSILAYLVYGLLAIFLLTAALAGYGGYTLTRQLREQSNTIGELDARYAAANKDLAAKLASTQDTLQQAQAQISRQQDLLVKQQEDFNRLLTATTSNDVSLKAEKAARLQDLAVVRARLHELDVRTNPNGATPKF